MTMLITGTSRGIGKELLDHYKKTDHRAVGTGRHLMDVRSEKEVQSFFRCAPEFDVVINNAGVASMNHSLLTPADTVQNIMETNFLGTFLVSREAAKKMKHGGCIINLSTVAVPMRLEGEAIYSASKAAVEQLTRVMARELAFMKIRVNAVGPCPVDTDLIKKVPKKKIDSIIKRQAIKRKTTVEDIAQVIDFFVNAEMVTGQVVYLGGGGVTVKELREMLKKYPNDMEVLTTRCSDYDVVDEDEWSIVKGVPMDGVRWVMRSHSTMSEENKAKEKEYLHLEGN